MHWQTSEPPIDREIIFEDERGKTRQGHVQIAGQFGMGATPANLRQRMRDQYMMKDGPFEMFEIKRWREID